MNGNLENQLRVTFAAVREATPIPPVPSGAEPAVTRRPKTRRASVVTGVVLGLSGLGLGVAVAGGGMPGGLWGDPHPGAFNAVLETGHLAVTNTDSEGEPIQLWVSDALGDPEDVTRAPEQGYCVAFVLPDRPAMEQRTGGGCSGDVGTKHWTMFASAGIAAGDYFARHVPGAARVVLVQRDGTRKELVVGEGWTVGRIDSQVTGDAELIGYDAAGREVGRAVLPDLRLRDH